MQRPPCGPSPAYPEQPVPMYGAAGQFYGARPMVPQPVYAYRLIVSPGRVKGRVSEFREATATLSPAGVALDGRGVLPQGTQALILIASLVVTGILIAAILLEYVIRVARTEFVPWDHLDRVVLDSARWRVCLVYRVPDQPTKPISLAFKLDRASFPHFTQAIGYFAPGKVHEGKIGGPTTPATWCVLIGVLLLIIGFFAWLAVTGGR